MHFKIDQNLILLWVFLSLQILVLVYFLLAPSWGSHGAQHSEEVLPLPVKFVGPNGEKNVLAKLGLEKFKTYYNAELADEIYLRTDHVTNYFVLVNDTLCFKYGTDVGYMERNKDSGKESGKCECLRGYHSNDCSLPEVIWRAFIASRHAVITKRGGPARRIILALNVAHPAQIQEAAVLINTLAQVVDLYVVSETAPFYFRNKLDKGLLKEVQYKILYTPVPATGAPLAWNKASRIIRNLRDEDIYMEFASNQIPSPKALLFFKLFDGFSLPVSFRLKWNVYGYFYQHPNRTTAVRTGSTIQALEKGAGHKTVVGLVVGDLNHYGGWLCDLCYDPNDILNLLQTLGHPTGVVPQHRDVIDVKYLEQLIGDGHYLDGKTELLRTNQDRDSYYAPPHVTDNYWKFDALLINFYNKIDYN